MGNTVSAVWKLAEPIALKLNLTLWDVRFVKEGSIWYLRVFIDKDGGVTIDDCEAMSRALDSPLDELDAISQSYCLEVSSPGIERELTRDEHFEKFKGSKIIIQFIRPIEKFGKTLKCVLSEASSDDITVEVSGHKRTFDKKLISSVKLDDFGGYEDE